MRFFEYDPAFIAWLISYAGRREIIDVGSGEGHLIRDLRAAGRTGTIGIDFRRLADEDVEPYVIITDATTSEIARMRGALLVLARPCHGAWISQVIQEAQSEVLYIGRPSCLLDDIMQDALKATNRDECDVEELEAPGVHASAGGERIAVWSITPPLIRGRRQFMYFYLVNSGGETTWMERRTSTGPKGESWTEECEGLGFWVNSSGGGYKVRATDTILEGPVKVRDDRELDWTRATWVQYLIEEAGQEKHPSGWLAPDGTFRSCEYSKHDQFAFYVLKHEVRELEAMGYARVHYKRDENYMFASRRDDLDLTDAQAATMERLRAKFATVDPWGEASDV